MVPQNTEEKSELRTNSPLKTRLFKKEYVYIKPLGWIPTQFVEHKRRETKSTATALAFERFSESAISMLSEESDWYKTAT